MSGSTLRTVPRYPGATLQHRPRADGASDCRQQPTPGRAHALGLIPHWAKDEKTTYKMINARVETLTQKPAFRGLLSHSRCLVPASGFYEWEREGRGKTPYYSHPQGEQFLPFAGLYDTWTKPDGEELYSFTTITKEADDFMASLHNRMPVILAREVEDDCLDPHLTDTTRVLDLLSRSTAVDLNTYPVSRMANTPSRDDKALSQRMMRACRCGCAMIDRLSLGVPASMAQTHGLHAPMVGRQRHHRDGADAPLESHVARTSASFRSTVRSRYSPGTDHRQGLGPCRQLARENRGVGKRERRREARQVGNCSDRGGVLPQRQKRVLDYPGVARVARPGAKRVAQRLPTPV